MARFDVYANPAGAGYVLDVQADILGDLNTRLVVPLLPSQQAPPPARRLNPVFHIAGEPVVMVTQFMAAVPCAVLHAPLASLADQHSAIMAALDMALIGF